MYPIGPNRYELASRRPTLTLTSQPVYSLLVIHFIVHFYELSNLVVFYSNVRHAHDHGKVEM